MKIQNNSKFLTLTIAFLSIPIIALANAGSPMLWFGIFHCLFLNAIIGMAESAILTKLNFKNTSWIIIVANYFSMFIGLYFLAPHFSNQYGNHDFWGSGTRLGEYQLNGFFIGMLISYISTLFLELPFFYFSICEKPKRRKVFFPFFIANTVTNLIMILLYYLINADGYWQN